MINSAFEIKLKQVFEGGYSSIEQIKILKYLINEVKNLNMSQINLDFIAGYIHQIFSIENLTITTLILELCYELEKITPEYITEKYNFDKLIVITLDYRTLELFQITSDLEELAYNYCNYIISKHGTLPNSIVFGLISINDSPKFTLKNNVLLTVMRAIKECPTIWEIPQLGTLFMKFLMGTNNEMMLAYVPEAIECSVPFVIQDHFISELVSPFTQINPPAAEKFEQCSVALCTFLRSWPGLIHFGMGQNVLVDLLTSINHQPERIIDLFRDLIYPKHRSIPADAFCAYALFYLIESGLIKVLNDITPKCKPAALFLEDLLPYIGSNIARELDLSAISSAHAQKSIAPNSSSLVFKLAQSYSMNQSITNVSSFVFNSLDPYLWEWHNIYKLLFIILPHNESECQTKSAANFFTKLFECFANAYLSERTEKSVAMEESLIALFKLFVQYNNLWSILESSTLFKKSIDTTLNNIIKTQPDSNVPYWPIFKISAYMTCYEMPTKILKKWNLYDNLLKIGTKVTKAQTAQMILNCLQFNPDPSLANAIYTVFLDSTQQEIVDITISTLKSHIGDEHFATSIFKNIIVPKLQSNTSPGFLSLFCDCIVHDKSCLAVCKGNLEVCKSLENTARSIRFLVAEKDMLLEEIYWWMSEGNTAYVDIFNATFSASFTDEISQVDSEKYPSLMFPAPPHLFGALAQTHEGICVVRDKIENLLSFLRHEDEKVRLGALLALCNFGSSEIASQQMEMMRVVDKIMDADLSSYTAIGIKIAAISLLFVSPYVRSVMQRYQWVPFDFGQRKLYLPPVNMVVKKYERRVIKAETVPRLANYKEVSDLIVYITNPKKSSDPRVKLRAMEAENAGSVCNSEVALFAMKQISTYYYKRSNRVFLLSLLNGVPLIGKPTDEVDPSLLQKSQQEIAEIIKS